MAEMLISTYKRGHSCNMPAVRKDWIESSVIQETVQKVLTDEIIEVICNNAVTLQNKERDKSILHGLKQRLNEKEKADIEYDATEQIEKPFITVEQVRFYLEQFRDGDIEDESYCRDIIDVFVRSVYIYDDKYCITYYYSQDSGFQAPPNGSDLKCFAPPTRDYTNFIFTVNWFALIVTMPQQ